MKMGNFLYSLLCFLLFLGGIIFIVQNASIEYIPLVTSGLLVGLSAGLIIAPILYVLCMGIEEEEK